MLNNNLKFNNINFFRGNFKLITMFLASGGYLVAPAASALIEIKEKYFYRISLQYSKICLPDSGFFCLLIMFFKKKKINKFSGFLYCKKFINTNFFKTKKILLIEPNIYNKKINSLFLRKKGFYKLYSYIAPNYFRSNVKDNNLIFKIKKNRPNIIFINISGLKQELLAKYILQRINFKCSILCTGAALGFLSGTQAPINDFFDRFYMGWFIRLLHNFRSFYPRVKKSIFLYRLFI